RRRHGTRYFHLADAWHLTAGVHALSWQICRLGQQLSKNASQCSVCVPINRNRAALSFAPCHPVVTHSSPMIGASISQ
ncbi:MAG: hypothetical protein WBQ55_01805, partial [Xanthobacteraceae bacterium]